MNYLFFSLFFVCSISAKATDNSYVTIDDFKLSYRIFGKGEPLVVINGGPGRSSQSFTDLAEELSEKRKVILFDQRGTGKSILKSIDKDTISFSMMIEDLERLREHLGHKKISILGHSFGGMYAMAYAAKYPMNVQKLILSASGGIHLKHMAKVEDNVQARLKPEALKTYKFWTSDKQKKSDPIKAKLEALRITAPLYVMDEKYLPLVEKNLTDLDHYNPDLNQLVWKSLKKEKYDLSGKFADFRVPTTVIDCDEDFLGPEIPTEIQKNIPGSRLEIIKGCRHYPWLDQPKKYFELIDTFLKN